MNRILALAAATVLGITPALATNVELIEGADNTVVENSAVPGDGEDLNRDIVSSAPEAQENCEDLRERLEARRDDRILNPQDIQELRDAGC